MTPTHRTTALCCALLALPYLIAPSATADPVLVVPGVDGAEALVPEELGGACFFVKRKEGLHGSIAIVHRGSFPVREGFFRDGCGGQGCDDYAEGRYPGDKRFFFYIDERATTDGGLCRVNCYFQYPKLDGTIGGKYYEFYRGFVKPSGDTATFACGNGDDPEGWVFSGRLAPPGAASAADDLAAIDWGQLLDSSGGLVGVEAVVGRVAVEADL